MKFKIFILITIALTAFTLWILLDGEKTDETKKDADSSLTIFKEENGGKMNSASVISTSSDSASAFAQTKKYKNAQHGFSFNYPQEFTAKEFPEEDGKISLIIQNAKTNQVVQIFVTSYDDKSFESTSERIKHDLPDLPFSNSADIVVGDKAKGVAFFSKNDAFGGDTAEAWFADGKTFFQITASAKDARLLEEIVKSWKF